MTSNHETNKEKPALKELFRQSEVFRTDRLRKYLSCNRIRVIGLKLKLRLSRYWHEFDGNLHKAKRKESFPINSTYRCSNFSDETTNSLSSNASLNKEIIILNYDQNLPVCLKQKIDSWFLSKMNSHQCSCLLLRLSFLCSHSNTS